MADKNWQAGGKIPIRGVNIGGWFSLEPFITPSFFQKYAPAGDEWDVSVAMANDTTSGGLQAQMENHYNTFIVGVPLVSLPFRLLSSPFVPVSLREPKPNVMNGQTEEDIAQIAGAGLNWIRLPIAYWAIETWAGEAFLEKVQWKYVLLFSS